MTIPRLRLPPGSRDAALGIAVIACVGTLCIVGTLWLLAALILGSRALAQWIGGWG